MASEKAKKAAAARLARLDKEAAKADKVKRNQLRTKVAMGDRKTRKKAATELSNMPKVKQWKD
jgi:hypothetical protein